MGNQSEKNHIKIIKLAINRTPYSVSMLVKNKYRNNELHFKNQKIIKKGRCFQMKLCFVHLKQMAICGLETWVLWWRITQSSPYLRVVIWSIVTLELGAECRSKFYTLNSKFQRSNSKFQKNSKFMFFFKIKTESPLKAKLQIPSLTI